MGMFLYCLFILLLVIGFYAMIRGIRADKLGPYDAAHKYFVVSSLSLFAALVLFTVILQYLSKIK